MARKRAPAKRVWIVLGWAYSGNGYAYSSTPEQRWHRTRASAEKELREARKRWTGTNWMLVRMHPALAPLKRSNG